MQMKVSRRHHRLFPFAVNASSTYIACHFYNQAPFFTKLNPKTFVIYHSSSLINYPKIIWEWLR